MYKSDVIAYYGTAVKVTSALKLKSSGSVSQWGEIIPEKQAFRIDRLTGGKLVYNPGLYRTTQSVLSEAVA